MAGITNLLRASFNRLGMNGHNGHRHPGPGPVVQRANRAAGDRLPGDASAAGIGAGGEGWARPEYGRYMATSPSVYAAVKLRAEAVTRPPLRVYRVEGYPSPQPSPTRGEGGRFRQQRRGAFHQRRGGEPAGSSGGVASGGAAAGAGQSVVHADGPVAGHGDLPGPYTPRWRPGGEYAGVLVGRGLVSWGRGLLLYCG